jgi:coatomer protein complex subunit epsilon
MEPDDLYTLRAQYWLAHYNLCLDEGKSLARRPMGASLKEEREEFMVRAQLALGQSERVIREHGGTKLAGIRALVLRAKYEVAAASGDVPSMENSISQLQAMLNDQEGGVTASVQLTACHVFLLHGDMTREALQCVHLGTTMEHLATCLQIYLKMDRLDLAEEQLRLMKQADEDAILTQLCQAFLSLATGSSRADDAIYVLTHLTEQYGPSSFLLNCLALANISAGRYDNAESTLREALAEDTTNNADTLVNLCVCYQHLGKDDELSSTIRRLKESHPNHFYVQGLHRVEAAIEREAVKYAVA